MLERVKNYCQKNVLLLCLVSATFPTILCTGIIYKQKVLFMLPLFISLIVMFLQANVNRFGWLLGAFNSLLYAYYSFSMGLMSSAISNVAVSFTMQLISFFTWNKRSKGAVTKLKRLSPWQIALSVLLFFAGWATLYFGISKIPGAAHSTLDTLSTAIGLATSILTILCFSEYVVTQLIGCGITIALNTQVLLSQGPAQVTHLIYAVYCTLCVIMAAVRLFNKRKSTAVEEQPE